jgi:hypothetical protein
MSHPPQLSTFLRAKKANICCIFFYAMSQVALQATYTFRLVCNLTPVVNIVSRVCMYVCVCVCVNTVSRVLICVVLSFLLAVK